MVSMNCTALRDFLPDLASGVQPLSSETEQHLRECSACAGELDSLRHTMALLDEWQVPEPSSYFDARLRARLRAEQTEQAHGWLSWLRRPALAVSLAVLLAAGVAAFHFGANLNDTPTSISSLDQDVTAQPGTAVGDLQALDKNHDMYADFDLLDELDVQNAQQNETP